VLGADHVGGPRIGALPVLRRLDLRGALADGHVLVTTVSAVGQCSTDLLRNDEDPQLAACSRQPVMRADKRRLALNEGRSPHRTTA